MTADDRRQQLADDVEQVLMDTVGTQMRPGQVWNLSKPLDALLPLFDRVAADAAAEALEQAADHLAALGIVGQASAGLLRARAAAHRTPAPSSEENARG